MCDLIQFDSLIVNNRILPKENESSFVNMSNEEFFGNLQLTEIANCDFFGRESLIAGRESLGILNISQIENLDTDLFLLEPPKITVTNENSPNLFGKLSNASSVSSEIFSFNSELSAISRVQSNFSLGEQSNSNSSVFNKAFMATSQNLTYVCNDNHRQRIRSLPVFNLNPANDDLRNVLERKRFLSLDSNENVDNKIDSPEKSVFVEQSQSIFDKCMIADESNFLENTPQPEQLQEVLDELDWECPKLGNELSVLKKLDQLLPPVEIKIESNSSDDNKSNSRETQQMLQDLSEILNTSNRSDKQLSQGRSILLNLADVLCGNSINYKNLDDSGHSSTDQDLEMKPEIYEILDLRLKNVTFSKSESTAKALDLSIKKSRLSDAPPKKRLSQSFTFPKPKSLAPPTNAKNNTAKEILSDSSSSNFSAKFKKSYEEKSLGAKKGPLKAVIPITNMVKNKEMSVRKSTPKRGENQLKPSGICRKKTSTPLKDLKIKPIAQSTPDGNLNSTSLKMRRGSCPVSPLARPSGPNDMSLRNMKEKLNYSSTSSLLSQSMKINDSSRNSPIFRRSFSENKSFNNDNKEIRRCFSTGKKSGILSAVNRVRENLKNSVHFQQRNSFNDKTADKSILNESSKSVIPKLKISGKENAGS